MTLRDSVSTAGNTVSPTGRRLSEMVRNRDTATDIGVAAYRKLIVEEVGDTWMRRSRGLERDFERRGIFLKFEGDNPTGTQKDRIAFAHVADALERGFDTISFATCGNYGVAVALAANLAGLDCQIFIPAGYHTKRLKEMKALGGRIFRPEGTYEKVVEISSGEAMERGWYDANPGGNNADLQMNAYSLIAEEIVSASPVLPDRVAVPVSNGTLLAGIWKGFVSLHGSGRIDRLPKMIAASSTNQNPIVSSFLRNSRRCIDLDPNRIRETHVNEPLINWHSFDGQEALDAVYASGGDARHVSDEKMKKMSAYLSQKEALQVLPASTAGLIALIETGAENKELQVAVLTAKR